MVLWRALPGLDKGKAASTEVSWESAAELVMVGIRKKTVRKEGGREVGKEEEGGREGERGW